MDRGDSSDTGGGVRGEAKGTKRIYGGCRGGGGGGSVWLSDGLEECMRNGVERRKSEVCLTPRGGASLMSLKVERWPPPLGARQAAIG